MSDALTDIARDAEREGLLFRIGRLEREFVAAPSAARAAELEALWRKYMGVGRGYWGASDAARARERVAFYRGWKPGDEVWLARLLEADGVVIRYGAGFIVNSRAVEEVIERALLRVGGPLDYSVFRLKLTVEAERLTCAACPFFGDACLMGTACNSRVEEELAVRKARCRP